MTHIIAAEKTGDMSKNRKKGQKDKQNITSVTHNSVFSTEVSLLKTAQNVDLSDMPYMDISQAR